ncbi:PH domain-containing protein [Ligilactobacillus animalis]|uniref:PH domain-containing protein n=1 Tax=Ligilactobacillus animalis TaxID=1605 RepID=UPI002943CDFC|nr:PH domain-containing protein [Ligilactobacillus animalis]
MKARRQSAKYFAVKYTEFFVRNGLIYLPLLVLIFILPNFWTLLLFLGYTSSLIAIFLRYFTTTYRIEADTLTLTTGIIAKTTLDLKQAELSHTLSNFRVEQTIYQKLFRTQGIQIYLNNSTTEEAIEFFALTPEQLAQLQDFLVAFQPAAKTGFISTRYLAYLALVLQLEEQFPRLQHFFDITALWFGVILVSGALLFNLTHHYISFAKFSLWETEHNFIVKNHFFTADQNTIPKKAIVGLELTSELNRRLFKLTCVTAILANSDADQDENRSKNFLFPLLPTHELLPTLARYFPQIPRELFELPSYQPKLRYRLGYLLKIGTLGASLYFILQFFISWLSALGVIITGMLLLSRLLFEPLTTRMAHTPDYFIFTSGLINKRTYILPRKMLASVKTTDYLDLIVGSTLTFTTTDGKTIRLLSTDENIL